MQFGDLPASTAWAGKWDDEAAELRANPQRWALLCTKKASAAMVNAIKSGRIKAFRPAGAYEATSRGHDVWVRYVGGKP